MRLFGKAELPITATPGLLLRPLRRDDYEAWLDATTSCEDYLRRWQPTWPADHLTRPRFDQRYRWWSRERAAGRAEAYVVLSRGRLEGMVELSAIRHGAARSAQLGYWIAQRAAGRGLATAAAGAACAHAFGALGLLRLEASCAVGNEASLRVLRKTGFVREGVGRSLLELDGERRDHVLLARLAGDPAGRRP